MTNPIGVISMFHARPFTAEHFPLFRRMKAAGMDFVELLVPEPGELDLAATRAALDEAGLDVALAARVNLTRDLASPDRAAHAAGVAYLETCVDVAAALGARVVGGPLYGAPLVFAGRAPTPIPPDERKRRVDAVVSGLKQAGRKAADAGILLAVEPLNRFETDFAITSRHGIDLVDRVDSKGVALMLDTFHMNMEDPDLPAAIRAAGPSLVHFQANENHRGFIGSGHIDWPAIAGALRDIGYDGMITLEPFRRDDEELCVPLAQWRPPSRDEDGDLKASGERLRAYLAGGRA
jgi:D-psicose/D-tagatose/L-ribulose 3-epimerase